MAGLYVFSFSHAGAEILLRSASGVKGNFYSVSTSQSSEGNLDFLVGGTVGFKLNEVVSLETGFVWETYTFRTFASGMDQFMLPYDMKYDATWSVYHIPLLFRYHFSFLSFGVGSFLDIFGTVGGVTSTAGLPGNVFYGDKNWSGHNIGILGVIGVSRDFKSFGAYVDFRYKHGLSNLSATPVFTVNVKDAAIVFGLMYKI